MACDLYLPMVTSNLVDKGIIGKNLPYIWKTGALMLLVSALGFLAALGNIYFAVHQAMQVGQRLRGQIFHKVLRLSGKEVSDFSESFLITRTTNDVVQIQQVFMRLLRMLMQAPLMLIAACVLAYLREPRLTIVFAVTLPILALIIFGIMRYAVTLFKSIQKKTDRINLIFREGLTGVWVIRAFRRDQTELDRLEVANQDYTQIGIKAFTIVAFMLPIVKGQR